MSEGQREYETVFILDPGLEEARVNEEIERAVTLIRENGGTVEEVERWGRRRLAYEIARKRDGVYTLVRYHAMGPVVKELERRLRLNELVLRAMTVVADPRYKEMMAASARAAAEAAGAGEEGPDLEEVGAGERRGRRRGAAELGDEDEV